MNFTVFCLGFALAWIVRSLVIGRRADPASVNDQAVKRLERLTEALESGELGGYRITTVRKDSDGSVTRKVYDPQLGELDNEDWEKDWCPEDDEEED